jgi:hypothetical protein
MNVDKAHEILKRAMTDPDVYHAMAARENGVMGENSAGSRTIPGRNWGCGSNVKA